ncbi:MAG: DeoR/GlpR transcriptional regulator [Lachnospiraceae bacterium]|nr:DeoR/GlpR transcriptional regulator [Lachnospiraceae bacterium]
MPKKRIDMILDILNEQGYVTVKYLTEQLHFSTATINRDLNLLQKQQLIHRHYGGAELVKAQSTPLVFRYHKMRPVKKLIGKKAAELIKDGQTIFIDASTTAQCLAPYITNLKHLTVITNNMTLASHLSEHNINCICLGGRIVEVPFMLGGIDTETQARSYTADIMFFSTSGISESGKIYDDDTYLNLHRIMTENSKQVVYLADHNKLNVHTGRILFDLSGVDAIVTDHVFKSETMEKFHRTKFITVETPKTQR